MEHVFPFNPTLISMAYNAGELTLVFNTKGKKQTRQYGDVPAEVAYSLCYKSTASELLKYYARSVRKKFKLIKINYL